MSEYAQSSRREAGADETAAANRSWWDAEAGDYYAEHGAFLGDAQLVWGPEGWREEELTLLGDVSGRQVLEIGAGAGQCARWVAAAGGTIVATDLSAGMVRQGLDLNERSTPSRAVPFAQCDAVALPFADASFDLVFTSYGAVPFVADTALLMREVARVLRPSGRFVFSTTHPFRWAFPDDPGPVGLTVGQSYFDHTPYVESDSGGEASYVEHHRTIGDRVRELVAAGMFLADLVEPTWPERNDQAWGGWSPLRGRLFPGTAIFICYRP